LKLKLDEGYRGFEINVGLCGGVVCWCI